MKKVILAGIFSGDIFGEEKQAKKNIAAMFRQCGIGYDKNGNPIFDKDQLQNWFKCNVKKDYTEYDAL